MTRALRPIAASFRRSGTLVAPSNVGRAKLGPTEEACIREAADALLSCTDITKDRPALAALAALALVIDELI